MPCCCPAKDGGNSAAAAGGVTRSNPPSRQSMNDRNDANDDNRAVNWWRERQKSKDEEESENAVLNTTKTSPSQENSRTKSREQSQKIRMEQRDPLQKPYEIQSREKPLHPRNGDVIQPTLPAVMPDRPATGTTTYDGRHPAVHMEIFRPAFSGPTTDPISLGRISSNDKRSDSHKRRREGEQVSERITAIEPIGSEDFLDSPSPRQVSIPQLRKHNRQQIGGKAKSAAHNKPFDDNLSDVPSDVDSVTKERFLLACHMLKTTLMLKEKSLEPLEREFILSLLGDFEDASIFSEDQLSAVEQATLRLENDPLFQISNTESNASSRRRDPPPSPMTAATMQRRENATKPRVSPPRLPSDPSKHPHTATLAKPLGKMAFLTNRCSPRSLDDVDMPAETTVLKVQEEEEENRDRRNSMDDGSATNMDDTRERQKKIRFDGWSNHKSAEYPFRILGADDPQLKPRVLTPAMMEAFQGFLPYVVSESNYWLKFSLVRDGASLATLLSLIRTSSHTIIGVETTHGEVFGSFTSSPWRNGTRWFGTGEAFLWRLKNTRYTSPKKAARSNFENEMEVYPYTGYDELVQYCTSKTIAVGGGDWIDYPCPFQDEPTGIGFMIDGDLVGGESNSCATFANPRLCKNASAASNAFSIANLEVWTLTPCVNVKDAAKMEVQKLFIEDHYR